MEKKNQTRDIRVLDERDPLADLPPLPIKANGPDVAGANNLLPPPPATVTQPAATQHSGTQHSGIQRKVPKETTAQPDPPTKTAQKLARTGWRNVSNWILGISLFAVLNFGLGIALALFLWAGALDQYMDDIKALAVWTKQLLAK